MPEAGGPTTQAGIFYQNTVSAMALADLLELAPLPPRERVVEVRVEAPEDVDDTVIRYADGHRQFQSIKLSVKEDGEPWTKLWASLEAQRTRPDFAPEDRLTVVLGESDGTAIALRELCERAASSADVGELHARLTKQQEKVLGSIGDIVEHENKFELLRRTRIQIWTPPQVEMEFARRRLGGDFVLPATLLTHLRDIIGNGARRRAVFLAAPLRRRLMLEHNVELPEPAEWGLAAYRSAVHRLSRIEIPGTGVAGSAEELFVWPRVRLYDRSRRPDFEDEQPGDGSEPGIIDLRAFPSDQLHRCVIVAGPGYGKSALLTAIGGRLAAGPFVPVLIPLATMAATEGSVLEFLATQTSREMDVRPDWQRLAEQGLLTLLFDGLDEIPAHARPTLQRRLATFSARYPRVPWTLTVRDPAVLIGAAEAETFEILPLEDEDIVRFAEAMRRRLKDIDVWRFTSRLKVYPDLYRLARIPLFLAMLLATVESPDALPSTRSDLIEAYLKTLLTPHEHKVVAGEHDGTGLLRDVAEALAFERLERQEIGATEREVRATALRLAQEPSQADRLCERLRANGVLRQQGSIRLQFPYPIVQEYLAACHIVRHVPNSLASRVDDALQRPWAQVIQFALEMHPEPTPIIRAMLDRSDDAFCTGLRLVGRCMANGSRVDGALRREVGDRLVAFWVQAPTRARERVGRLLFDGFASPPSPDLARALHHRWLMHDGAGDIISRLNDPGLTLSVLQSLIEHDLGALTTYHSLKPALNAVGDAAFELIVQQARRSDLTARQREGVCDLLEHLETGSVGREAALTAALDERIFRPARLQAFRIVGAPLDERALPLIKEVMSSEHPREHWAVSRLIELHRNRSALLLGLLRDEHLSLTRRRGLAGDISRILTDAVERSAFIQECVADEEINPELVSLVQLIAARYGNAGAFKALVESIPTQALSVVGLTISLFGHYPSRDLALHAADLVRTRVCTGPEAASLAGSAVTGMLYVFEMDFGLGGALRYTQPHAATEAWKEVVEGWSERGDLTDVQRLKILSSASKLGSERARDRLQGEIVNIGDPDAARFAEDDYGHTIADAIREVRRRCSLLPLSLLETLIRAKRPNVPIAGVSALEAHGNHEALTLMARLHRELDDYWTQDQLANAIEALSSKLGCIVEGKGGAFSVIAERR